MRRWQCLRGYTDTKLFQPTIFGFRQRPSTDFGTYASEDGGVNARDKQEGDRSAKNRRFRAASQHMPRGKSLSISISVWRASAEPVIGSQVAIQSLRVAECQQL
jgi:hypothetical protein